MPRNVKRSAASSRPSSWFAAAANGAVLVMGSVLAVRVIRHPPLAAPGARMSIGLSLVITCLSFTIGMTFQVSDVAVLSHEMRRLTMIHGVLSFTYNIAILAMSINIIGNVL